jgi:hypothetical protein
MSWKFVIQQHKSAVISDRLYELEPLRRSKTAKYSLPPSKSDGINEQMKLIDEPLLNQC